jgi:DNA-binding transcriptional LysR family regulator
MNVDTEIEVRHLRYFVAVAEELHFGRAAQRLHIAQPPLSQQIRRLEELLGYPLFERTSRSVALTAAGKLLLERARRTLSNLHRDFEETRSIGRGEVGSLHIGFVGSAMLTTLPEIFRRYRKAYPKVRLQLHESFTAMVVEGLQNGTLDVGLLRDGDATEGLTAEPIFHEPFVAVLPAAHPRAKQRTISAGDLREEPFVYYPRSAGRRAFERPFLYCEEFGFQPRIVQEASHWLTILRLIASGLGVSIAPECVRQIASAEIVCVPLERSRKHGVVTSQIEMAWREGERRPIVERFAAIVEETIRGSKVNRGRI